jgi:hypothetical protein
VGTHTYQYGGEGRPVQRAYNRLFGTHIPKGAVQELALLSARQLRALFPTSRIAKVRVTFWPETLVAYHIDPGPRRRGFRSRISALENGFGWASVARKTGSFGQKMASFWACFFNVALCFQ